MSNQANRKKCLIIVLAFLVTMGLNANADFTFGEPTNLGPTVNSISDDVAPSISADGLSLYFCDQQPSLRPGGFGYGDIWVTTRRTKNDPWGIPENLGPKVNSGRGDLDPCISADGCTLFFASSRSGYGSVDLFVTKRASISEPWGTPRNLRAPVNSSVGDSGPSISADGLSLYFDSVRPGGIGVGDIWVTTRTTKDDDWGEPVNLGQKVNSTSGEWAPSISADGLLLFLHSYQPGANDDLFVAKRSTTDDDWESPVNLGPKINKKGVDLWPNISADGSTLYFASNRTGGLGEMDIWQAPIEPVVDFNGDSIVDSIDMCIMVDHWGTDEPLCDIGPMPWGDGVVDVQDLTVLAAHLFEDHRLVANWALDETEGDIAYDSSGNNHGTLNGNPIWQPIGGKYDGALEFDGIDDYISTPFVLDPAKGSLSAFAWIKSVAPGHVIISQTGGFGGTWIGTNAADGRLMTGLSDIYFGALESETVITDGQWHHVGLVYALDSLHRRLYVDGARIAEDTTVVAGVPSNGGLYIGASKDLDAASFFTGLIDDVRIYNVVLSAVEIEALAQ